MTVFRTVRARFPSVEVAENGEDAERTLTVSLQFLEISSETDREMVVTTVVFPTMTPNQLRCAGQNFELTAQIAEDERERLRPDRKFKVPILTPLDPTQKNTLTSPRRKLPSNVKE